MSTAEGEKRTSLFLLKYFHIYLMIEHEQLPPLPTTMKLETFLLHSDFGFQFMIMWHSHPHKQLRSWGGWRYVSIAALVSEVP